MLSRSFFPILRKASFKGVNAKDSIANFVEGEWDDSSINVFSDPEGAVASRPGYSALTTASIGTATAWCGFYQFVTHSLGSTNKYPIGGGSDGKIYHYTAGDYTEIGQGFASTDIDVRFSFFTLDNTCIICDGENEAVKWTGSGSVATFATSVTADFGLEWQRYGWLHSTVDPRLMYYSPLGDPDGGYSTFLNFDEDGEKVIGASKQGDDMIIAKQFSLFRVQYRGTTPLFKKYRIPSKIGFVSHFVMKTLPDGRLIGLAPDCNFYMVNGDNVIPVGDNIKPYIKNGVRARLENAVAGMLYERNQYWCSFTYTSGATQNDRTVVMDWERPYQDIWGNVQYPWFIYSIPANCFAEIDSSGNQYLYHGGYSGLMYQDNTGTNDNGSAFSSSFISGYEDFGDPTVEKKVDKLSLALDAKGDWNLNISLIMDGNASTEKTISQNLQEGLGTIARWDEAIWDTDVWSSENDIDVTRDIMRQGKIFQLTMGTTGLDEAWRVYYYTMFAKPLKRGFRKKG